MWTTPNTPRLDRPWDPARDFPMMMTGQRRNGRQVSAGENPARTLKATEGGVDSVRCDAVDDGGLTAPCPFEGCVG